MTADLFIDFGLVSGTLLLAWLCVTSKELFRAIVLFVSLGLFVTIAWARLEAWDVAIAEAAIGAGLTGALLLTTWRRLQDESAKESRTHDNGDEIHEDKVHEDKVHEDKSHGGNHVAEG